MGRATAADYFTRPHTVVLLLSVINTAIYLWCVRAGHRTIIPLSVLVANGALIPDALQPDNWWRLVAAGFLHASLGHLLGNMVTLYLAGPFLERRLGPVTFALVYMLSLLGGSIASVGAHHMSYVGVGASGAIFGVIGALYALTVLGATEIRLRFFVVNFVLNFFLARNLRVDWTAHLGGFVAGLLAIAVLEVVVRTNRFWLVCGFPEFVKGNVILLFVLGGLCLSFAWPQLAGSPAMPFIAAAVGPAALLWVKLLDVLLAVRHGLVGVVLALVAANGAAVALLAGLAPFMTVAVACRAAVSFWTSSGSLVPLLCERPGFASLAGGGLAMALTLLAYAEPLLRGVRDVGFIGASLKAKRQRERGLIDSATIEA